MPLSPATFGVANVWEHIPSWWPVILAVLALSGAWAVMKATVSRHEEILKALGALPAAVEGNTKSIQRNADELEKIMEQYKVCSGLQNTRYETILQQLSALTVSSTDIRGDVRVLAQELRDYIKWRRNGHAGNDKQEG